MGVSKVNFGITTLIDLTEDSVDAASLLRGKTAHNRAGDKVDGTLDVVSVHVGSGMPSPDLGSEGDIYLDMGRRMAAVVTKELNITVDNAKTYCIADHLDLAEQTYAFKKYFSGRTDGYATLNDTAKEAMFPSAAARPFKADSEISCSRSGGTCIVALQFDSTDIHSESFTSITQQVKSKSGIIDAKLTSSTRFTQIRWHIYGGNSDSQRVKHAILKLYFNQYTMQAIGDGVADASVSDASPYQGDTVIFFSSCSKWCDLVWMVLRS